MSLLLYKEFDRDLYILLLVYFQIVSKAMLSIKRQHIKYTNVLKIQYILSKMTDSNSGCLSFLLLTLTVYSIEARSDSVSKLCINGMPIVKGLLMSKVYAKIYNLIIGQVKCCKDYSSQLQRNCFIV